MMTGTVPVGTVREQDAYQGMYTPGVSQSMSESSE